MIKKGLVYAIIPARSGSTSVKDKNIRSIRGHPLMAYSIAAAKMADIIDRTIVTTDSVEYAKISKRYGAEAPFIRPKDISGNLSTDIEFMEHAISWFDKNEGVLPEFWIHLRPTSPLRDPDVIQKAFSLFCRNDEATCLRSAHLSKECPFKWFTKDEDGYYRTITGITPDEANGPRQSYPDVFIPNGYVDILRTDFIIKNHKLHGDRVLGFEVPPTVDIDYEDDINNVAFDDDNVLLKWLDDHNPRVRP